MFSINISTCAAIVVGLPRIDPIDINNVTTVSLKSKSFSFLNESGKVHYNPRKFELSSNPSSKSNSQALFCLANNCLCNLFAALYYILKTNKLLNYNVLRSLFASSEFSAFVISSI